MSRVSFFSVLSRSAFVTIAAIFAAQMIACSPKSSQNGDGKLRGGSGRKLEVVQRYEISSADSKALPADGDRFTGATLPNRFKVVAVVQDLCDTSINPRKVEQEVRNLRVLHRNGTLAMIGNVTIQGLNLETILNLNPSISPGYKVAPFGHARMAKHPHSMEHQQALGCATDPVRKLWNCSVGDEGARSIRHAVTESVCFGKSH